MKPSKLIEILERLPPDCDVKPNAVGNLMLTTGGDRPQYCGYIDFVANTFDFADGFSLSRRQSGQI